MLTDREIATVALRIVDAELTRLATYDHTEQIDRMLCADCPPMDCARDSGDFGEEIRSVHQQIKDVVATLRLDLTRYAASRNISIPTA